MVFFVEMENFLHVDSNFDIHHRNDITITKAANQFEHKDVGVYIVGTLWSYTNVSLDCEVWRTCKWCCQGNDFIKWIKFKLCELVFQINSRISHLNGLPNVSDSFIK